MQFRTLAGKTKTPFLCLKFGSNRSNGLHSETLHTALRRALFVMSQSMSEWIFRPMLVML